jgi:hypothetical protein
LKFNYLIIPRIIGEVEFKLFLQNPTTATVTVLPRIHEVWMAHLGTNLPPRKCLPENDLTPSFGAVKLIKTSGSSPRPSWLPFSTSHPEGISTDTMGSPDEVMRGRTESNGARTGPLKEKPNMASRITSEDASAARKISVLFEDCKVLIFMLSHCCCRR